jgi:DNA polymerase-3 subunit gamma/tau
MTLYLKYRPQKISELDLIGVRETLSKLVKSGKIPHALLFSGPKGTGKTSAARIMAKVVNCTASSKKQAAGPPAGRAGSMGEPCNKCSQCISITKGENLDVIELDAASHRGIDDMRALRDVVKLAPAGARKKVYIIDEAHMLTTEASNALLKTLEEPPAHVMFILATTNPEKLIGTIRSRTTNIVFNKPTKREIVDSLMKKKKGEKLKIATEALALIAKAADHSFRDADKILEQLISEGEKLGVEEVGERLFQKKTFDEDEFIAALIEKDASNALKMIESTMAAGGSVLKIIQAVIDRLRSSLLAKVGVGKDDISKLEKEETIFLMKLLIRAASEISDSILEQIPLEIAVVEWCEMRKEERGKRKEDEGVENGNEEENEKSTTHSTSSRQRTGTAGQESIKGVDKNEKVEEKVKLDGKQKRLEVNGDGISEEIWTKILTEIRPKNTSTEALLRATKPVGFDGHNLTLGVFYTFHKEKLECNPHRDILEGAIASILGNRVRVICILTEPPGKSKIMEKESVVLTEVGKTNSSLTKNGDEDIIKIAEEIFK